MMATVGHGTDRTRAPRDGAVQVLEVASEIWRHRRNQRINSV